MIEVAQGEPGLGGAALGIGALIVLGPLLAWAFRRLRVAGAALAGGVLAGFIAGPAFFGRIAPDAYIRLFEGPPQALRALELSHSAANAEAMAAMRSAAKVDDHDRSETTAALERATQAWDDARVAHRRPFGAVALLGAALILASSMSVGARRAKSAVGDVLVAAWSALVPALAVVALMALRGDALFTRSTAIVAAACACGAWCVAREDRAILHRGAARASRGVASISAFATTIASVIAVGAVIGAPSATMATLAIVALVIGTISPLLPRWRRLAGAARVIVIPAVAALLAVHVDPARDLSAWLVVVLFLIAEDVRWLGAFVGHGLGGNAGGAMRHALAGLGVGPTMVAFTALGVALQAIAAPMALALLIAAVLTDCFAPIRLRVAQRLEPADAELDDA